MSPQRHGRHLRLGRPHRVCPVHTELHCTWGVQEATTGERSERGKWDEQELRRLEGTSSGRRLVSWALEGDGNWRWGISMPHSQRRPDPTSNQATPPPLRAKGA